MADWIQAIGVIISLVIAAFRYSQVKRGEAFESVKRMLNLTDEFDILMEDTFRFSVIDKNKVLYNGDAEQALVVNFQSMRQEVLDFEGEFKANLNDLWEKLSAAKITWRLKAVSDNQLSRTLNDAAVVERQLKKLMDYLEQDNMATIQMWKRGAAKSLLVFADELTELAVDKKLVKQSEVLKELYPSLQYYVVVNQAIEKKVTDFLKDKNGEIALSEFYKTEMVWIKKNVYITSIQEQLHDGIYREKKQGQEQEHGKNKDNIRKSLIRSALIGHALLDSKNRYSRKKFELTFRGRQYYLTPIHKK